MKLHCTITSPYVRKVWVVAHEAGIADRIKRVPTNPHRDEYLRLDNPLCRVPTLLTDEGEALFDSPVICEYLDSLHDGPKLFPANGADRWRALRLQALGDGLLDALLARRAESLRPTEWQSQPWVDRQMMAVEAGYAWLESRIDQLQDVKHGITIGHVAIACALGYTEVRFPDDDWRQRYPQLARWYHMMSERPSMVATHYLTLKKTLPPEMLKERPATHP